MTWNTVSFGNFCQLLRRPNIWLWKVCLLLFLSFACVWYSFTGRRCACSHIRMVLLGMCTLMMLFNCMVRHGTVRYGSLLGGFPLSTVPGTFLVPPRLGFQAIRTVTKTWRVNATDHWLAGENRHYRVTELATLVPTIDPLDLNQHSQRGIGCTICLNKRNFSTKKWLFRGLLRKYRCSSRWSPRSGSSKSLMVRRGMKKFFRRSLSSRPHTATARHTNSVGTS